MIIPGVNDGDVLRQTCNTLEEWGAKGMLLMRFANTFNEGLILGNEPIIKGIESQPVEEFGELVKQINSEYKCSSLFASITEFYCVNVMAFEKTENLQMSFNSLNTHTMEYFSPMKRNCYYTQQ